MYIPIQTLTRNPKPKPSPVQPELSSGMRGLPRSKGKKSSKALAASRSCCISPIWHGAERFGACVCACRPKVWFTSLASRGEQVGGTCTKGAHGKASIFQAGQLPWLAVAERQSVGRAQDPLEKLFLGQGSSGLGDPSFTKVGPFAISPESQSTLPISSDCPSFRMGRPRSRSNKEVFGSRL